MADAALTREALRQIRVACDAEITAMQRKGASPEAAACTRTLLHATLDAYDALAGSGFAPACRALEGGFASAMAILIRTLAGLNSVDGVKLAGVFTTRVSAHVLRHMAEGRSDVTFSDGPNRLDA